MTDFTYRQRQYLTQLRSGNWLQCRGRLWERTHHWGYAYCPTGLAMRLFTPKHPLMISDMEDPTISERHACGSALEGALCMRENAAIALENLTLCTLSSIGDAGARFSEIADFIERNPGAVFTNFQPQSYLNATLQEIERGWWLDQLSTAAHQMEILS